MSYRLDRHEPLQKRKEHQRHGRYQEWWRRQKQGASGPALEPDLGNQYGGGGKPEARDRHTGQHRRGDDQSTGGNHHDLKIALRLCRGSTFDHGVDLLHRETTLLSDMICIL